MASEEFLPDLGWFVIVFVSCDCFGGGDSLSLTGSDFAPLGLIF